MINQSILRKVLIVGTALLLAASGSKAYNPFMPRYHTVMVKTSPGIQSIYVVGVWGNSPRTASPETKCYRHLNRAPGWHYIGFMALNETRLQILTFTSPDCTTDLIAKRVLTVPPDDGLRVVWVDASH